MDNIKYINGPINMAKMEGYINNIKKTIYLFMDFHEDRCKETDCNSITKMKYSESINLEDFLHLFLKYKKNIYIYDLFFESRIYNKKNTIINVKGKYISEFNNLFMNYEFLKDGKKSKSYDDLRIHNIDFRDMLSNSYNKKMNRIHVEINYAYNDHFSLYTINNIILLYTEVYTDLFNLINKIEKALEKHEKKENIDHNKYKGISLVEQYHNTKMYNILINKYIYKIIYGYHHEHIQKKIHDIIKYIVHHGIDILRYISEHLIFLNEIKNNKIHISYIKTKKCVYDVDEYICNYSTTAKNITDKMLNYCGDIKESMLNFYCNLMDVYAIRRITDKNKINNILCYTGIYHSANYINILVNDFNFKLIYVDNVNNVEEYNKLLNIINNNKTNEIMGHLLPNNLIQCVNIKKFLIDNY
jgi:hypothetical protein